MHLSYRRMTLDDIPQCYALPLLDGFAYDAPTRARIPDLWRELLLDGGVVAWVVEDRDRPRGAEIVAMEMAVFIADAFVTAACTELPPYLSRNVVDAWLAGRSPILALPAVRAANSGPGLNMICLHTVTSLPITHQDFIPIHEKNFEAYRSLCAGFYHQHLLVEVYGTEQMQWNLNSGMRLRTDYAGRPRTDGPSPPPGREPYLIGATREEAAATMGSILAVLFQYAPPRFFFNPREQDLLETALTGLSDEEAAAALCISHPTVRKRWESIYDKVSRADPALLGDTADFVSPRSGAQKKRLLLSYLRDHPEELRPVLPLK